MYAILLISTLAHASGNYPAALEAESGASCQPSCLVCHSTATGGSGTATAAFAVALKGQGLTGGGDTAGLADALAAGIDPSTGEAFCGAGATELPAYGCVQHARAGGGLALAIGSMLIGFARRRREG